MADNNNVKVIKKYFTQPKWVLMLGWLGAILWLFMRVKDEKFDDAVKAELKEILPKIKARALSKIGLDESEVKEIAPVTFSGYNFDNDTMKRKGKDGVPRSNAYEVSWLFFSATQVYAYKTKFFINNFAGAAENTEEYFYKDITNFSTATENANIDIKGKKGTKQDTISWQRFSIIVPGDKFSCSVNGNIEASVQAMKKVLREKKNG